jgi:hypothetical protein
MMFPISNVPVRRHLWGTSTMSFTLVSHSKELASLEIGSAAAGVCGDIIMTPTDARTIAGRLLEWATHQDARKEDARKA